MSRRPEHNTCARAPGPKEIRFEDAGYSTVERSLLTISRHFWQTFAVPESQSWLYALQCANDHFDADRCGEVGLSMLACVQAMRMSRVSCFRFNNPICSGCAAIVSEHERQFMNVLQATRDGRPGSVRTHAMILCEGNDTENFLERMRALVDLVFPQTQPRPKSVSSPNCIEFRVAQRNSVLLPSARISGMAPKLYRPTGDFSKKVRDAIDLRYSGRQASA